MFMDEFLFVNICNTQLNIQDFVFLEWYNIKSIVAIIKIMYLKTYIFKNEITNGV
jgi:hypothetical protein